MVFKAVNFTCYSLIRRTLCHAMKTLNIRGKTHNGLQSVSFRTIKNTKLHKMDHLFKNRFNHGKQSKRLDICKIKMKFTFTGQ